MADLERETYSAEARMAVADALDEVRFRNARLEKLRREGVDPTAPIAEDRITAEDKKDEEDAKRAFALQSTTESDELPDESEPSQTELATDAITRQKRPPKHTKLFPGLKRADAPARPTLVEYGSDSD